MRYSLTGELPPGSNSGRAFIHDPRCSATTEVKARVNLDFKEASGALLSLNRNIIGSLDQKTGNTKKREQDVTITRTVMGDEDTRCDGKKRKLNTMKLKTKEVEQQLPDMIGVSKAILDNVIFVHQEDSTWPLGDSAALKKRFDDMFAAARYTKAMEQMRTISKGHKKDVELYKARLNGLAVSLIDIDEQLQLFCITFCCRKLLLLL